MISVKSFYIYVLELENNKYYVHDIENSVDIDYFQNSFSISWTKKNKVKKILYSYESKDPFDKLKEILKLMEKYGIDNVRGKPDRYYSSWRAIDFSKPNNELYKMISPGFRNRKCDQKSSFFIYMLILKEEEKTQPFYCFQKPKGLIFCYDGSNIFNDLKKILENQGINIIKKGCWINANLFEYQFNLINNAMIAIMEEPNFCLKCFKIGHNQNSCNYKKPCLK